MKIDDESVYGLCNSLNAISGLWPELPHVRLHILKAQEMITVLYEENKKLKGANNDNGDLGHWVDSGDPLTFSCSRCGYEVARYNNTPCCPNCGKKMEVK